MQRFGRLLITAGVLLAPLLAKAGDLRLTPYGSVTWFQWEETIGGSTVVEEEGPLFAAGLLIRYPTSDLVDLDARIEVFGGVVDYDGAIFNLEGDVQPYSSESGYAGLAGDATLAFNFADNGSLASLRPAVGLGFHRWVREIDRGGQFGYDEIWTTLYARGGLDWVNRGEHGETYAQFFVILPLANDERVEGIGFEGVGDIDLEPETETGFSLVAGHRQGGWDVALTLDLLRFGESDLDPSGLFFQPESDWLRYGIRAGITF